MQIEQNICDIVRKAEQNDINGETTISKYVKFPMRETIEKVDAYLNSKHISGDKDALGRDKPFFNIVTAAVNIWYRATDIDRKNIKIKATKRADYTSAFIATILLEEWMRKNIFGIFLNDWGRTLARYGSAISKHVEKGKKLYSEVIPWNRIIVDPVDFENNIKIEKLWLTPAQLKSKTEYNQDLVDKLLEDITTRTTTDGQKVDNKADYIPIYEIHGELPLFYITGKEDDKEEYTQQMHVITFLEKRETGDFEDYTLISGRESRDPYLLSHLIKEDGRTLSIGAVEHLFEAQWMQNHTTKLIKDQLDLASKIIFQTSDGSFVGQNTLSDIEHGDILMHKPNQPLTELNNQSHDIAPLQSFQDQWKAAANKIVGTSEAMLGAPPKSGTAWRQTQALLQESHSLFELMTENKGLAIEEMMRKYIIPHIKKKMDTTDEISAILNEQQIKQLDRMFVPNKAIKNINQKNTEEVLSGRTPVVGEEMENAVMEEETRLQEDLNNLGNQRFIKPSEISDKKWKEVIKDLEWDVDVNITNENKDTEAIMATLTSVFQTIAGLGGQPMTDEMKLVFNKILISTGHISPIELATSAPAQSMPQQAVMPQGKVGGAVGANNLITKQ